MRLCFIQDFINFHLRIELDLHVCACLCVKFTITVNKGNINLSVYVMIDEPLRYFLPGEAYKIDDSLQVIPTPGHTTADVSVVVNTAHQGTVVIAG